MNQPYLRISGAALYDPANGVDGEVRDLWICDGRITAPPADVGADSTLDASGLVILPGGVDMHCHIVGTKVNAARKLLAGSAQCKGIPRKGNLRSGTWGPAPTTFATGYRYLGLGYTTAFDAAISPITARHAHEELADTPCIDKGIYLLAGNNSFVLESIAKKQPNATDNYLAWLVNTAKGHAIKLVNPGGVAAWQDRQTPNVCGIDDPVQRFGVTPREIIREVAASVQRIGLPHTPHVHCTQLGMPGNWRTTLETMQALEQLPAHLTHIQFHSYGGEGEDEQAITSRVPELVEYVMAHPNITVDVGQVLFDKTISMTADGPAAHYLSNLYGSKLISVDVEAESVCGVSPIAYRNKSLVNSWQWAIGLEWFLLMQDPWRIALSTDHPNGGSFVAYPQVIRLLMDSAFRKAVLDQVHPQVREQSALKSLDREYTLGEIANITRAAPARMLGLGNKGHLGIGADADITIYSPQANYEQMFALPRYVFKAGQLVCDDGEIRAVPEGRTWSATPDYDEEFVPRIRDWFEREYSIAFENYGVH